MPLADAACDRQHQQYFVGVGEDVVATAEEADVFVVDVDTQAPGGCPFSCCEILMGTCLLTRPLTRPSRHPPVSAVVLAHRSGLGLEFCEHFSNFVGAWAGSLFPEVCLQFCN